MKLDLLLILLLMFVRLAQMFRVALIYSIKHFSRCINPIDASHLDEALESLRLGFFPSPFVTDEAIRCTLSPGRPHQLNGKHALLDRALE